MYKTNYKQALEANGITRDDLMPKTQIAFDEVVSVEAQVIEIRESLTDSSPEDRPGINESLNTVEAVLQTLDEALVKKIHANKGMKERVQKMQDGRKNSLKNKTGGDQPAATTETQTPENKEAGGTAGEGEKETPVVNMGSNKPAGEAGSPNSQKPAAANPGTGKKTGDAVKKGGNYVGWVIGAAVTVFLAGYGIHAKQNNLWPFKK